LKEHQIRYYGFYSNKKRGMPEKGGMSVALSGQQEPDTAFRRKCRMTWAALIKCVYEVDPLKCPGCGGEMRIVSFIEQEFVVEKIVTPVLKGMEYKPFGFTLLCLLPFLRYCGLWK
jgi:hypothetical protein